MTEVLAEAAPAASSSTGMSFMPVILGDVTDARVFELMEAVRRGGWLRRQSVRTRGSSHLADSDPSHSCLTVFPSSVTQ